MTDTGNTSIETEFVDIKQNDNLMEMEYKRMLRLNQSIYNMSLWLHRDLRMERMEQSYLAQTEPHSPLHKWACIRVYKLIKRINKMYRESTANREYMEEIALSNPDNSIRRKNMRIINAAYEKAYADNYQKSR